MSNRTDRAIRSIIGHLAALEAGEYDTARHALIARRNHIDGYPSGSSDPKVAATTELTSTEAAANRRHAVELLIRGLDTTLDDIAKSVLHLRNDCRRYANTPIDKPRCDGGAGREGHLVPRNDGGWSTPGCENIPPEGRKTCDACRKRARRWAHDNGIRTSDAA